MPAPRALGVVDRVAPQPQDRGEPAADDRWWVREGRGVGADGRCHRSMVAPAPGRRRAVAVRPGWEDSHRARLHVGRGRRHTREADPIPSRRRRSRVSRLQTTDGLTEEQHELIKLVREFVERADHPGRDRARAQGRVPHRHRRGHEGDGDLRPDDPRGVRRSRRVAAHLRPGRRGDRAGLDVGERHHQHALHRRLPDPPARHRGAEAALPAADGDRRGARGVLDVRARAGLRRRGDPHQGRARRATSGSSPARRCG